MATHDYVIANGTGAAVRSDLNNALAAIVSNNSGSTEPATTYAFQWWADTTANVLKIRNSANNAWITLRELDGTMLIEDGSASTPGLAFADDVNTGIFSPAADQIGFATGGAERLEIGSSEVVFNDPSNDVDFRVESNGNTHMLFVDAGNDAIGIGTSSATSLGSGFTEVMVSGATEGAGLQLQDTDGNVKGGMFTSDISNTVTVRSITNHPLTFRTNNTEAARIDSSGRLLVGTSSARGGFDNSSVVKSDLQVEGVGSAASANRTAISIVNNGSADADSAGLYLARSGGTSVGSFTAVTANDVLARITFSGADGSEFVQAASIEGVIDGTPGANDMPGSLRFSTTADGASSATERLRINSSGNVGIGETAPLGKLHVRTGDSGQSSVGASADEFVIEGSGHAGMTIMSGTDQQGIINFADPADVNIGGITYNHSENSLVFRINDAERMRVNSFGNFMVGQTNGSSGTVGIVCNANGLLTNCTSNVDASVININNLTGAKNLILFRSDGTNRGSIETNGSTVTYNTTSDYRVKENVVDIDGAIDRVKQLLPKRFNFISHPEQTVDGFLAHEAQTVVPEAVTGTHNGVQIWEEGEELPDGVSVGDNKLDDDGNTIPDYQGIDHSKLVPLLTAALQEAIAKIETLETKVAALEAG